METNPKLDSYSEPVSAEDRNFVTPYAFSVSPDLLGTPLAAPWKRCFALLVDLLLVALLALTPSVLLALVAVYVFWRESALAGKLHASGWITNSLRGLAALILFFVVIAIVQSNKVSPIRINNQEINAAQSMKVASITVRFSLEATRLTDQILEGTCDENLACLDKFPAELGTELGKTGLSESQGAAIIEGLTEVFDKQLDAELQDALQQKAIAAFREISKGNDNDNDAIVNTGGSSTDAGEQDNADDPEAGTAPGLLAWLKAIASEMGLGFGWSAFYFTAFTAWWKGQTPGKRLLGLKVIKLNGKCMNLWESFGRYGGYGAGLATGLLGFIQIFWDANRQAIQDKISETLVIDVRRDDRVQSTGDD